MVLALPSPRFFAIIIRFHFIKNKTMSHHDIHAIITQIAQTLDCPQCKNRILPHHIQITDVQDQDCLFDVTCQRCNIEMSLSAHIERSPREDAMTYNRSSQILHDQYVDEGVTALEVELIQEELANFSGSFIETFAMVQ